MRVSTLRMEKKIPFKGANLGNFLFFNIDYLKNVKKKNKMLTYINKININYTDNKKRQLNIVVHCF